MPTPINATTTAANPIDGTGTILEYALPGTPTVFHQIANMLDIKPKKMTAPKKDTTTHSTTGGVRTSGIKMGESGETEVTLLYDKVAYAVLAGLWRTPGINWRVTMNDAGTTASTDACLGTLAEYGLGTPLDGDATIEIKISHSGASTFTAGT